MNRMVIYARVGTDGVLHLDVPIGATLADREVAITIEPTDPRPRPDRTRDEWLQFIAETAGAWQGELTRAPQGEYERREELP